MEAANVRKLETAIAESNARISDSLKESYAHEVMRIVAKCKTACATLANSDKNWTIYELGITAIKLIAGPHACHSCEGAKTEDFLSWATSELEKATQAPSLAR